MPLVSIETPRATYDLSEEVWNNLVQFVKNRPDRFDWLDWDYVCSKSFAAFYNYDLADAQSLVGEAHKELARRRLSQALSASSNKL